MTEMSLPSRRYAHPVNLMHWSNRRTGDTCPVETQDNVVKARATTKNC